MYKRVIKRILDVIISFLGLIVLAMPFLVIAIVIKIDSPGPVLFKQRRIGIHKKEFLIWKFRSMPTSIPADVPTHQFRAYDCLSAWQRFIRKSSLDELPQLFNILMGSMSFVGPRPALWNQEDLIAERDLYGANDVKPGLTGWAQIKGRDELSIAQKAEYDGQYAKILNSGHGFWMDVRCFFGSISAVVKSKGYAEGGSEKQNEKVGTKK